MNVLIIGLGSIGKKHASVVRSILPDSHIYAFRSKMDAKAIEGVTNIYGMDEVSSIGMDFAIIANNTSEHKRTLEDLTKYRFPVFIEKPIYFNLSIESLAKKTVSEGLITYVACNLRFLDCLKFVNDRLTRKMKLDEVNVYCGSYLPDWRPNTDFRSVYSARPELGGGVHLDLIHELDYLYWFWGKPKVVHKYLRSQSSLLIPVIDYANYLLDYDGFSVNVVLNYYRKSPKRCLELVFEDETWNVDLLKNQIICNHTIIFSSEQRIEDTYYSQMEYFIKQIVGNGNSFNTISEAYEVLKICLD